MIPVLIVFMVMGFGGAATYHESEAMAGSAAVVASGAAAGAAAARLNSSDRMIKNTPLSEDDYIHTPLIYSDDLETPPMEPEPESTIIPMPTPKNERQAPVDRLKSVEQIQRFEFYDSRNEVNTAQQENENE